MSSIKVKRVIRKAASKAIPIIYEECSRLGIKTPKIEWVSNIFIGGTKEIGGGAYQYNTQKIILNIGAIEYMIEWPEPNIIRGTTHMYFHEFKHYIDHKVHGVTFDDFWRHREKYEAGATSYADEMMKRV